MEKSQGKKEVLPQTSLVPQIEIDLACGIKEKRLRILHVDDDVSFLYVSKNIISLLGNFEVETATSAEEALRKMRSDSFDAVVSDYEMSNKNGLELLTELKTQKIEVPFILFTGKGREEIIIEALNLGANGYVSKHGNPETVYGELAYYIRQAVENKQARISLSQSEQQLKSIIMNAPIGISVSCRPGELFETANAEFSRILGYTQDELRKLSFKDVTYPGDIDESIEKMKELKAGKILAFRLEKRYVRKDGTIIYCRVNVSTVKDETGKICLFIAQLENISERKKMEDALKQDQNMLEAFTQSIGVGFVIIGRDYRILYANNFIRNYKGDSVGKLCYATLNTLDAPCLDCGVAKIFAGKS